MITKRLRNHTKTFSRILLLAFCLVIAKPIEARALSKDVKAVMVTSLYGLAGGTALGLVSLPAHKSVKGVFMGTSVGLYLGILIGIYFIHNRDDPDNPLISSASYHGRTLGLLEREHFKTELPRPPKAFEFQYPVMMF